MSRKQLMLLFFSCLIPWTVGCGLMPLLPVYAIQLGASSAVTGYYLAFAFLALAVGTVFAGWLSDRIQRRKILIIITGTLTIPTIWMMGRTIDIWYLTVATASIWFLLGIAIALINVLAGLFAAENERGRVFCLLGLTLALGAVLGGLFIGPLVDQWGYRTMFTVLALFSIILPITSSFLEEQKDVESRNYVPSTRSEVPRFGRVFILLLSAHVVAVVVNGAGNIGRSLAMNDLGFAATAITSTGVIEGIVSLPFPFFIGWLSDRVGRKRLMMICYLFYTLCMVLFAVSKSLWHFWLATAFFSIGAVSKSVGAAYITDIVDPKFLGRGISLFQSMYWVGNVVGLAVAGYAFQNLGISFAMIVGAAFPLIGITLLIPIRVAKQRIPAT